MSASAPSSPAAPAVDWQVATRRARSLVRPGPRTERAEAALLVESLRSAAVQAPQLVGEVTGLGEAAERARQVPMYVVDRARWIESNVDTFAQLTDGLLPPASSRTSARLAGEELGVVLPMLASRVLGQYDPFGGTAKAGGHLMLVAPNVLHVQRELRLEPADFHLWVALHEQTHALQFAAAPWLAEHMRERMRTLMGSMLAEDNPADRLKDFLAALPRALAGDSDEPAGALLGSVLSQREHDLMGELVAVMSLLEGHADVVMDAVGPRVVPTVARIRSAFDKRRNAPGWPEVILRRLMGMDAKLAQYRNGASFVRAVVDRVGHEGLNAVWDRAQNLPTSAEISDAGAWVARVHP